VERLLVARDGLVGNRVPAGFATTRPGRC